MTDSDDANDRLMAEMMKAVDDLFQAQRETNPQAIIDAQNVNYQWVRVLMPEVLRSRVEKFLEREFHVTMHRDEPGFDDTRSPGWFVVPGPDTERLLQEWEL
jgi:hypothetical protein